MYYLDFRVKYPPPDSRSEQVGLFIEKMRSRIHPGNICIAPTNPHPATDVPRQYF